MRPPPAQVALAQKYGKQYGVDPRLLLAIGQHETQFGTLGAGRQGYTLGYGATDSGTISKYAGVENQYRGAASLLGKWGAKTLQDILHGKAERYATDPNWEQGVARAYKGFGGALPPAPPGVTGAPVAPNRRLASAPPQPLRQIAPETLEQVNQSLAQMQTAGAASAPVPGQPGQEVAQLPRFVPKAPPQMPRQNQAQPLGQMPGTPPPGTPPSPLGNHVVQFAAAQLGQKYVWGGESRKEGGFDCSGLVDYALRQAGVKLPFRVTTYSALKLGRSVKGEQLQPGDMIISNGGKHMTLYAGNGKVIAAPHRGEIVQYQPAAHHLQTAVDIRRI